LYNYNGVRKVYSFAGVASYPFSCSYRVTPTTPTNHPPRGWLDSATCTAAGWAQDEDTPNQPIQVHFYIGGPAGTVALAGTASASAHRDDLCSAIGSCDHGFYYQIPQAYRDGQPHTIYAYGIDNAGGPNPQLSGSPKTFTCDTPVPPLCPDGSAAPGGDVNNCPQSTLCPDGTPAPGGDVNNCPTHAVYCPDGSVAPGGNVANCPTNVLCPDGSPAPGGDVNNCLVLCPDGSPAPGGDVNNCNGTGTGTGTGCVGTTCGCPVGYTLVNGHCVFDDCPSGYTKVGNQCIQNHCPAGYTMQSGHCVFISCPAGYVKVGNQCIVASCPASFFYCGTGANEGNLYQRTYGSAPSCTQHDALYATCDDGCNATTGACNPTPAASGSITAKPSLVRTGDKTQISWSAVGVSSCTVTANNNADSWSCTRHACDNVSQQSSTITAQTTYTLSCTGFDHTHVVKSAIVDVIPVFNEQ
ncbi:MAG: hypothetical protein JOZ85_12345, partial [Betaproteobacteria bacterium]|nr:hypothetical protein [Betaproteobacteria bacterium]